MNSSRGSAQRRRRGQRGATLVEGALAFLVFAVLMAGILQLGLVGAISSTVSFAAQRAVRYASVRGGSSGHAATVGDIQSAARQYAAPFNGDGLSVTVTWSPDNNAGSRVTVKVAYNLTPSLLPITRSALNLQATASQSIVQ
jgi:Flp pilus assembly protein TadG